MDNLLRQLRHSMEIRKFLFGNLCGASLRMDGKLVEVRPRVFIFLIDLTEIQDGCLNSSHMQQKHKKT
uniref:Uncharacterized protein n=1 Tax=Strigamia maritima TaxID=126957 RepID=T1JK23_STRMM